MEITEGGRLLGVYRVKICLRFCCGFFGLSLFQISFKDYFQGKFKGKPRWFAVSFCC